MTMVKRNRRPVWIWIGICIGLWGCTWFKPAPEPVVPALDFTLDHLAMEEALPQPPATPLPEPPTKPPEEPFFIHSVSKGETLIAIARWYTGEGRNWSTIAKANPAVRPNGIRVGDKIKIPKELMITHKPIPRIKPAGKRRQPKPELPEPKPIQVELFGPIVGTPVAGDKDQSASPAPLQTID